VVAVNWADFLRTWQGTQVEIRVLRLLAAGLLLTNLAAAWALANVDKTVVLVPPTLGGEVQIARDSASREVREAWALYVAELLGNASPGTADFLQKAIEPLLASKLRQGVVAAIAEQVSEIKRERISIDFAARSVAEDPQTGRLYVSGTQTTTGPGGNPKIQPRTYEVQVEFRNYRPVVTHLEAYADAPRVVEAGQ
jgi:conjugal transfer pilus assembly protein TraE